MEPVVTVDRLVELPLGPGTVRLLKPLDVEITDDPDTQTVTIYNKAFEVSGDGFDYTEALLDFAGELESLMDDVFGATHQSARSMRELFEQYIALD